MALAGVKLETLVSEPFTVQSTHIFSTTPDPIQINLNLNN